MKSDAWPTHHQYRRISQVCGLIVVTLATTALCGWFIGSDVLRGIKSSYIPMAPNTALLFVTLGILWAMIPIQKAVTLVRAGALITITVAGIRISEYALSIDLGIDGIVFQFPGESLGLAPVGKMALFTAVTFSLLGAAVFLETMAEHWANDTAKALSIIVSFIGLAFSLGYLYGAPLLYGGKSIPMALNTAICFCVFGAGLLVKGSIRDLEERRLAEAALRKAHDELEVRVNQRTKQLSQAVASLEAEIAERKQAERALQETEAQLRQSQKLEAIGRLAGGIAHDFNNLLTVIIGYSDLLLQRDLDGAVRDKLIEINKASKRASSLTRQLLAFSRKQVMKLEILNINSLLEGTDKMLRRLIGEDVEVTTNLRPDVGAIMADPSQVEQVLFNLVVNARDAMPNGGKLTIQTANAELDDAYADLHFSVQPGSYVMLAVSDTGVGMDAETQVKIFEPFFTTKEVGKGTGLGLSMVYGIVKQCGGNIWVYSEVGTGTTFKIYLPRIYGETRIEVTGEKHDRVSRRRATETVLLVEDEDMVRKLASDILKAAGYHVLVAADGNEAIAIANKQKDPIHLLLTDVVMPRMTGKEVAQRIAIHHRETEVLYMSGYTDDAIALHGVLQPETNLVEKPFTADALLFQVASVLNQHRYSEDAV